MVNKKEMGNPVRAEIERLIETNKIVAKREEATLEEHERLMQLFAEGEGISGGANEDEE
jgi:hypothetical protein